MRVLVCGGRDYLDREHAKAYLDRFHVLKNITLIIQGGARGADRIAYEWAVENNIPWKEFEADWKLDGRAAGPIRNQRMLDEGKPDAVIAFPGNRGTQNMTKLAREAGLPIFDGASKEIIANG